ncbi:MAG: hypothetical protein V1909_03140 [Candidatus Micrarchaeota archaeon]
MNSAATVKSDKGHGVFRRAGLFVWRSDNAQRERARMFFKWAQDPDAKGTEVLKAERILTRVANSNLKRHWQETSEAALAEKREILNWRVQNFKYGDDFAPVAEAHVTLAREFKKVAESYGRFEGQKINNFEKMAEVLFERAQLLEKFETTNAPSAFDDAAGALWLSANILFKDYEKEKNKKKEDGEKIARMFDRISAAYDKSTELRRSSWNQTEENFVAMAKTYESQAQALWNKSDALKHAGDFAGQAEALGQAADARFNSASAYDAAGSDFRAFYRNELLEASSHLGEQADVFQKSNNPKAMTESFNREIATLQKYSRAIESDGLDPNRVTEIIELIQSKHLVMATDYNKAKDWEGEARQYQQLAKTIGDHIEFLWKQVEKEKADSPDRLGLTLLLPKIARLYQEQSEVLLKMEAAISKQCEEVEKDGGSKKGLVLQRVESLSQAAEAKLKAVRVYEDLINTTTTNKTVELSREAVDLAKSLIDKKGDHTVPVGLLAANLKQTLASVIESLTRIERNSVLIDQRVGKLEESIYGTAQLALLSLAAGHLTRAGGLLSDIGKNKEAADMLGQGAAVVSKCIGFLEVNGYNEVIGNAYSQMAHILWFQASILKRSKDLAGAAHQYGQTIESFERGITAFRNIGDSKAELKLLKSLAKACVDKAEVLELTGNLEGAKRTYLQGAEALTRAANSLEKTGLTQRGSGKTTAYKETLGEVADVFSKRAEIFEKAGDWKSAAESYGKAAYAMRLKSKTHLDDNELAKLNESYWQRAGFRLKKAFALEKAGDLENAIQSYTTLRADFTHISEFERAGEASFRIATICDRQIEQYSAASDAASVADAHKRKIESLGQAADLFGKEAEKAKENNDWKGVANAYGQQYGALLLESEAIKHTGDTKGSFEALQKAVKALEGRVEALEKVPDLNALPLALAELGRVSELARPKDSPRA